METCLEEFGSELLERLEVQVLVELQKTDVSPTAAVQRLLQAREIPPQKGDEPPSSKNAGNHAWFTIFSLVELASLTPAAQQVKLIEFVAQLQKIPVIDPATEQQLIVADDLNVWTDLPYRRIYLADRSGFRNVKGNYTEAEEYPPAEVQEWENRNAFMAQLTAAAVELGHPMDFSLYGCTRAGAHLRKKGWSKRQCARPVSGSFMPGRGCGRIVRRDRGSGIHAISTYPDCGAGKKDCGRHSGSSLGRVHRS